VSQASAAIPSRPAHRTNVVAWVAAIAGLAMAALGAAFSLAAWGAPAPPQEFGFQGFSAIFALEFAVTGLLIVTKQPDNRIGWISLVSVVLVGLQSLDQGYAIWSVQEHGSTSALARVAAVGEDWVWQLAFGSLALTLAIFPDGRPISRRWGKWIGVGVVGTGLAVLAYVFTDHPLIYTEVDNPIGLPGMYEAGNVLSGSFFLLLGVGLASLVVRLRRSRGDQREQVKWVAFSAGLIVAAFVLYLIAYVAAGGTTDTALANGLETLIILGVMSVPVAVAIGILKYHLYDIDVVISKTLVYGVLAAFIALVYIGIVIGVGTLVGSRGSPFLSAVAAGVVAIAFQPARARAHRVADRLVFGRRATPYEVLSAFSGRLAQSYSLEDVTTRLARLVADGTGAERASVWLREGGVFREVAATTGPPGRTAAGLADGLPTFPEREAGVPVLHQGEVLGAVSVAMPSSDPYTEAHERLLNDVASQTGVALRNVRLVEELRESRRRIVTAQDEERRRIERNIHDGAQQQLVALSVKLRLAEQLVDREPARIKDALAALQTDAQDALETLRDLARGIYPPLLADKGLAAALEAQARKSTLPVSIAADGATRYAPEVEAAVYFSVLEALQNVAKYADASRVEVRLSRDGGLLAFEVTDDGRGFDPDRTGSGTGLQGMADRLAALDGTLDVTSAPGAGTVVTGRIPVAEATP
jgi:signal transduction histidine kinase